MELLDFFNFMKNDSKKPCYCWFFRVSELHTLAVCVVLTRFCCDWVRWKADIQSFMKKKFEKKKYFFSWRKFILKKIFPKFPQILFIKYFFSTKKNIFFFSNFFFHKALDISFPTHPITTESSQNNANGQAMKF